MLIFYQQPSTGGYSYSDATGNDSDVTFPFTFTGPEPGYISTDDIYAYERDADPTSETYNQWTQIAGNLVFPSQGTVTLPVTVVTPIDGNPNIRIRRIMPKDEPYADTNTDDIFRSSVLNNSILTSLYISHEVLDGYITVVDGGEVEVDVSAEEVSFNPFGTGYDPATTDLNLLAREIDTGFVRKGEGNTDPDDPDNGSPLAPFEVWLVDSSIPNRYRVLNPNPANGEEITIRDDAGLAGVNEIQVRRSGNATIMGLQENMTISTN
jgi:hypothetical protein